MTRKLVLLAVASVLTSLVAGVLSGIPAAHHFGRLAPYGVIANALALPIVSIAVMPMALAATILMPLGLEAGPLAVMEQGLKLVMQVSDWVASWPHAGYALPLLSSTTAALLAFAAAFLCMAASALRWLSLPFLLAAVFSATTVGRPHILVEERARTVAAVDDAGHLVPVEGKGSRFVHGKWLEQAGQRERPAIAAKRPLWTCNPAQCLATVKSVRVAYLRETASPVRSCPEAEIVIAQYPLRRSCKGLQLTIDRFDVWRNGAHAITIADGQATATTARAVQGQRPWTWQPRPRARK